MNDPQRTPMEAFKELSDKLGIEPPEQKSTGTKVGEAAGRFIAVALFGASAICVIAFLVWFWNICIGIAT